MTAMISLPTSHFGWLSGHIGKLTPDALNDYVNDFWQRSILFLDILRRRSNQREDMMAHRVASRARSDRTPAQDGATMQHTQRIPVRIRLTQVPPGGLISAGMTCTVIMKDGAAPEIGIGIKKAIAAAFSARCNFQHPSVKGTAQSLRCGFGYRVLRRALDDAAWLVEALVRMSVAIQSQFMTLHSTRCWALWMGLSLATPLPLLTPPPPDSHLARPISLFDSNVIAAVSFLEHHTNAALEQTAPTKSREKGTLLFGMDTEPVFGGPILEKWSRAKIGIDQQRKAVARCRAKQTCPAVAKRLIELSAVGVGRSGRAQVGLINRAVDLAIFPISDEAQWGVPDHWSAPFETLRTGRGDCEDYAIVKYVALLEAGISENDVKIVILKNNFPSEHHAVLAVHIDSQWLILDNRTLTLVRDTDLTRLVPELILDQTGVRRFVSNGRNHRMQA